MAGSMHVEPHQPAFGTIDPASVSDVAAVHEAAVGEAMALREHYHQNALGRPSQAGDPQATPREYLEENV